MQARCLTCIPEESWLIGCGVRHAQPATMSFRQEVRDAQLSKCVQVGTCTWGCHLGSGQLEPR